MDRKIQQKRGYMEFFKGEKKARERRKRKQNEAKKQEERRRGERLDCHWRKEEKGFAMSFRGRQPHSPTHKVDKEEKDRAVMWLWFTPHRMTDPLSSTSFNMLMHEWTNVDYHRSCIAPQRRALSPFLSYFYSISFFSDIHTALSFDNTIYNRLVESIQVRASTIST